MYIYIYMYTHELATSCRIVFQCWNNKQRALATYRKLSVQRWSQQPRACDISCVFIISTQKTWSPLFCKLSCLRDTVVQDSLLSLLTFYWCNTYTLHTSCVCYMSISISLSLSLSIHIYIYIYREIDSRTPRPDASLCLPGDPDRGRGKTGGDTACLRCICIYIYIIFSLSLSLSLSLYVYIYIYMYAGGLARPAGWRGAHGGRPYISRGEATTGRYWQWYE